MRIDGEPGRGPFGAFDPPFRAGHGVFDMAGQGLTEGRQRRLRGDGFLATGYWNRRAEPARRAQCPGDLEPLSHTQDRRPFDDRGELADVTGGGKKGIVPPGRYAIWYNRDVTDIDSS